MPDEYGSAASGLGRVEVAEVGRSAGRRQERGERRGALGLAEHEHLLDAGPLGGLPRRPQERRDREEETRAGVDELVRDLVTAESGFIVVAIAAGADDAVEGDRELGEVRAEDAEHVAAAETARRRARRPRARRRAASWA